MWPYDALVLVSVKFVLWFWFPYLYGQNFCCVKSSSSWWLSIATEKTINLFFFFTGSSCPCSPELLMVCGVCLSQNKALICLQPLGRSGIQPQDLCSFRQQVFTCSSPTNAAPIVHYGQIHMFVLFDSFQSNALHRVQNLKIQCPHLGLEARAAIHYRKQSALYEHFKYLSLSLRCKDCVVDVRIVAKHPMASVSLHFAQL